MGYYMAGGLLDTLENLLNPAQAAGTALAKQAEAPMTAAGRAAATALGLNVGKRKHRRMHVTNVKALHRAMRRVKGFAHLARQTMTFTQHHKMKGRRRRR